MNRRLANAIRFMMDECLPPIIRDNKYFMYPFYGYAYRGKDLDTAMNFKQRIFEMSGEEYKSFYQGLDTISRNRKSDLSDQCIEHLIDRLDSSARSLLDVGCGRGYFLSQLQGTDLALTGCDAVNKVDQGDFDFQEGDVCKLPFDDDAFDVVSCAHTLEHILDLPKAASELKRVARKQLMVVVPCQRPYKYTLDEHVQFFMFREQLIHLFGLQRYTCEKVWGDWVYVGQISDPH